MDWISLRVCRIAGMSSAISIAWMAVSLAAPPERGEIRVARLIRDLGASDYSKRQQADQELAALGRESRESLERALADPDVEVRLRAKRLLERLALEDLWSPTRVNYQAHEVPASKILAALAAQTGNHIHVGDPYGNFAEKPLDLHFLAKGYWEALDEICHQTGNRIRPHYDMHTPGIVISAGAAGKYPRAYGGPVRAQIVGARRVFIEELNYEEQKAELTHSFQINLRFHWEDRFRMVGYATQPQLVEAVTDNQVIISAAQPSGSGWNATARGLREVTASLKLNPVPVSAKTLEKLTIKWGLIAVGQPATLELAELGPGKRYSQDDLAVTIEAIEQHPAGKCQLTLSVVRDLAMPEPHDVIFQEYEAELLDAEGRPYRLQSQSHALSDGAVQVKLTYNGESAQSTPKSLKLHYPRLRARRDVELVFRNVPLPVGRPE